MRFMEKKLPGFTVIFLHNPYECSKCSRDDLHTLDETRGSVVAQRKMKKVVNKSYPISTSVKEVFKKVERKIYVKSGFKHGIHLKNSIGNVSNKKSQKKVKVQKINKLKIASCKTGKINKKNCSINKMTAKSVNCKKLASSKIELNLDAKVNDSKTPGKGTLKRKRWYFNKLNNSNDNYEDDIFENEKFEHFQNLLEDDTDNSEQYEGMKTPVLPFSTSPRVESPSPVYKDCYSPTELNNSRKDAEEYHYRMNSLRKNFMRDNKKKAMPKPKNEKKKDENDVHKTLAAVAKILNQRQSILDKSDSEEDEEEKVVIRNAGGGDELFSDLIDTTPTLVT